MFGTDHKQYLNTCNPKNTVFTFQSVFQQTVLKTIEDLKNKNSSGWDNISTSFLKEIKHELMPVLTNHTNKRKP